MKPFTFLSVVAFLLFVNMGVFGQEKDITIITNDDDDDGEFFAFMPEMPMVPGFDDMEMVMEMGPGFGWNEHAGIGFPDPPGMPDELALTKDQTDKIKKIRSTARKQNIPLKSDIQLKEIELKELMDADSPDKNAVAAKVKEIDALRTQIKLNRMNARIDCRNVLTKEQKEKMEQMRSQRRMMHFDGRKHKMKFKREMRGE
jgi:Spy/CpxP family protein refolding chaperone